MSAQGMTLTVLCTGLVDAVVKDETPEAGGCDISAGMIGPNLSAWLREVADLLAARDTAAPVPEKLPVSVVPPYVRPYVGSVHTTQKGIVELSPYQFTSCLLDWHRKGFEAALEAAFPKGPL